MIINLLKPILHREQLRNLKMTRYYENEIKSLAKGKITIKTVNNNTYYYLKYRKDTKVITDYLGKDKIQIKDIEEQIEKRKHYQKMLAALIKEKGAINRIGRVLL